MRAKTLPSFAAMTLFVALGISAQALAQSTQDQIITFDAGPNGTTPTGINPTGEITGYYVDASFVTHGFVRDRDGEITTFDAPGVGANGTFAKGINPRGEIAGYYYDASNVVHGFVRDRDGTITSFNAGPNTFPTSINSRGEITGYYFDAQYDAAHGFVRAADGTITTFEGPGAVPHPSTFPTSINPSGEICGVTTTSGLAWKIPGRVGDSPILGAGLYLDNEVGAAGSTGRGEANLYNLSSFLIVENMRRGAHPKDAGMEALQRVKASTIEKRLLNEKGNPNFGLNFYILNARGEYAGV